jgi:hypothetical protein
VQWYLGARVQSFFLGAPLKFLFKKIISKLSVILNSYFDLLQENTNIITSGAPVQRTRRTPDLQGPDYYNVTSLKKTKIL